MTRRGALLLPALAGALALIGAGPGDVAGAWSFKTQPYDGGCVMSGELVVEARATDGVHACRLVAREVCPDIAITARQACTLAEQNGVVTITSTIVSTTGGPYAPDNFDLTLHNAARMSGKLRSADIAPVQFFRGEAPIA